MKIITLIFIALLLVFRIDSLAQTSKKVNTAKPSSQENKIQANETNVIAILKTINAAQATYSSTDGNGNFGSLEQLIESKYLPHTLAQGVKCGYRFGIVRVELATEQSVSKYEAIAIPLKYSETGRRSFYVDHWGIVRGVDNKGLVASVNDNPVNDCGITEFREDCNVEARDLILINEKEAINALRTVSGAQGTYNSTLGNGNYGSLKRLAQAHLITSVLSQGVRCGYRFKMARVEMKTERESAGFEFIATPIEYNKTGRRSFYVDESGVIRGADKNGVAANLNDLQVEQ